jgi:hypothetical protein
VLVAKLVPKIEITEPGATGALKLAAFTTPPGETVCAYMLCDTIQCVVRI